MRRRALILAAHGSRHEPAANELLRAWAEEIERRGGFDRVVAAFHQGEPRFCEVLDLIDADDVVVVPVMTSQGYYCDEFLPAELAKNARYPEVVVRITPPVGVHPGIPTVVDRRLAELAERVAINLGTAAVAIVGHGTRRNPRSRLATEELAGAIRGMGRYAEVATFFLDEAPGVEEILKLGHSTILVEPFLISGGPHATKDIPDRLGIKAGAELPRVAEVDGRRVVLNSPLGMDRALIRLISSLAREAFGESVEVMSGIGRDPSLTVGALIRLGTRGSKLARWQAEHVATLLRRRGANVEIVDISTLGDRVLDRPIAELGSDDPFTADIEAALTAREIDLAVHSLKDLPVDRALDTNGPLGIPAVLPRGSVTESLISRDGLRLRELPMGALIGTSSPRRAAQVLALRPGLVVKSIRGAVDDRVRQVQRGEFDAAILATAGLERLGLLDAACEEFSTDEMVPAPAQGAMAIQARRDDVATWGLCAVLDDAETRRAVTAELAFLRPYEHDRERVAAAHAAVSDDSVTLRARLITMNESRREDVVVTAGDPLMAADEALRRMDSRAAPCEGVVR